MEIDKSDIVNTLYRSFVLSGITIAYSMALRKFLRMKIGDPSQADLNEFLKLGLVVTLGNSTADYLYKNGIIPHNIIK